MTSTTASSISRRGLLGAFAATVLVSAPTYSNAAGFLRGAGDIRRIKMYSGRTGESIDTIYWIEGDYIGDAMTEVNRFFRDWRNGQTHQIDTRTIDIIGATQNLLDSDQPYTLISGYRSPQTNAMLRSNSSGVARNSLHLQGQAADLRMQGRSPPRSHYTPAASPGDSGGQCAGSNFVLVALGEVHRWVS